MPGSTFSKCQTDTKRAERKVSPSVALSLPYLEADSAATWWY